MYRVCECYRGGGHSGDGYDLASTLLGMEIYLF